MQLYLNKPAVPKEHGAWPVLIIPIVAGSLAVRTETGPDFATMAALLVAALAGFLMVSALRVAISPPPKTARGRYTAWAIYYGLFALAPFLWLVLGLGRTGLLWFILPAGILSVAYFWTSSAGTKRTLPFEMAGLTGLCAGGPAAAYLQQGAITLDGALVYPLCLLWFADRTFTARKTLELIRGGAAPATAMERLALFKTEYIIHAIGLALNLAVVLASGTGWPRALPYLAGTMRNALDTALVANPTDPMKVGFSEMRMGIIFTAALITAFRL